MVKVAGELEQSGASQVSLTDPEARAMSIGRGSTIGYNVQAAVDAKHSLSGTVTSVRLGAP